MKIDVYQLTESRWKSLCVPAGTDPADLDLPAGVILRPGPWKRSVDLDAKPALVGAGTAEIQEQIEQQGFALSGAAHDFAEDPDPRP